MNKVLVIEDEEDSRWSLVNILSAEHPEWIILQASSVKEGIAKIQGDRPDAVVTDWVFRGEEKSGRDVLSYVRQVDPFIMVIVVSAYEADKFDRYKDAFELGAYDVVSKGHPTKVAYKEISLKVTVALRLRSLHKASASYSRHIDEGVSLAYEQHPDSLKFESRLVSICFTDIRGFSALNKALLANNKLVAEFLARFYELVVSTTHTFGGVVDKFIGDGAMLLFGALRASVVPDDGDKDALNAVSMALDLRERIGPLLVEFQKRFARAVPTEVPDLSIGIGIHTAEVLVGLIKTEKRDQFTALGHGVNLAQRFEAAAGRVTEAEKKRGDILITKTVKQRVEEHVILKYEGELTDLKNISEKHGAWSVEGAKQFSLRQSAAEV